MIAPFVTTCAAKWTKTKPTEPGAYWVRGFRAEVGAPNQHALVEVGHDDEGVLCCNLHVDTTDDDRRFWYEIQQLDPSFEWCGPLHPVPIERRSA